MSVTGSVGSVTTDPDDRERPATRNAAPTGLAEYAFGSRSCARADPAIARRNATGDERAQRAGMHTSCSGDCLVNGILEAGLGRVDCRIRLIPLLHGYRDLASVPIMTRRSSSGC